MAALAGRTRRLSAARSARISGPTLWDTAPTSNADIGKTIARLLGLNIPDTGKLVGRVVTETMPNGAMPQWQAKRQTSAPDEAGRVTAVQIQTLDGVRYFDAAGYPGSTLGLPATNPLPVKPVD